MDKLIRFAVGAPRWQAHRVGTSAGRATYQLYNPWLTGVQIGPDGTEMPYEGARAGILYIARSHPTGGRAPPAPWPKKIKEFWRSSVSRTNLSALTSSKCPSRRVPKEGMTLVDGQQVFLEARRIKTTDEISLLAPTPPRWWTRPTKSSTSFLRPGVRRTSASVW